MERSFAYFTSPCLQRDFPFGDQPSCLFGIVAEAFVVVVMKFLPSCLVAAFVHRKSRTSFTRVAIVADFAASSCFA